MRDWKALGRGAWSARLEEAGVDAAWAPQLASFLVLLGRFARAVDLVGRVDAAELVRHHVQESLSAVELLPERGTLLDVGSGNGFPVVPLLVARSGLEGVLLEPRERRWAFLREVVRELGLSAEVRRERLEDLDRGAYDAVTVRGLGVAVWGDRIAALVKEDGVLLWWGGAKAVEGGRVAGMTCVLTSPLPDPGRGCVTVWRRRST